MKTTLLRLFLILLPLLLLPALVNRSADARLEPKEWRKVQQDALRLFARPGHHEEKLDTLALLVKDAEKRAWKLVTEALVKEAEFWIKAMVVVREKEAQIAEVEAKPFAKRYPKEQRELVVWKEELLELEAAALSERGVLDAATKAIADGPEALRKNLFSRAKGPVGWSVRAAAARVAAVHPDEKLSISYLTRALSSDTDPRVRMAALEALREAIVAEDDPEDDGKENGDAAAENPDALDAAEGLIVGRLADKDWGVQLLAVRIVEARQMTAALPHLINALAYASPRVIESIGALLQKFTGENFDPYEDVWAKWWEDHREEFQSNERVKAGKNDRPPSDAHFYGLPVKSDRILFIIDASSSMKLPTKNENPKEKWKPQSPATGDGGAPPPPPPPEEILSGPKIDVAKHELKKALMRLPPSSQFNIIAFNSAVLRWKDGMTVASEKNKKDALKWIRALTPKGSTYIDGALRLAFRIAGLGAVDRAYAEVNVDTMILLSDGAPTDGGTPGQEAKLMDSEIILEHVREWNRHKRIVIHAIGVDMHTSIEFLRKLAEENGGKYVDR